MILVNSQAGKQRREEREKERRKKGGYKEKNPRQIESKRENQLEKDKEREREKGKMKVRYWQRKSQINVDFKETENYNIQMETLRQKKTEIQKEVKKT